MTRRLDTEPSSLLPDAPDYERHFRALFEQTNDAVFLIGLDGRIIAANRRAAALLGFDAGSIEGLLALECIVPHEHDAARASFQQLVNGQHLPLYERTMITKDGTPVRTEIDAALVRNGDGTPRHVQSIVRDISTRKREEERHRLVVEGVSAVTGEDLFRILVRHFAAVLDVRSAFVAECVDTGRTRARTIAFWHHGEFIKNVEYDVSGTPCEHVLKGEVRLYPGRVQELFPDDLDLVDLEAVGYLGMPLYDSHKRDVIGHLVAIDDKPLADELSGESLLKIFSSRAGAEVERRRMEEQLLHARKMESLGLLAGGIAHDFNNLLMGILGNLSLAKDRVDPQNRAHRLLGEAERGVDRAKRLTQQLLTLSKGGTPIRRATDVATLVRESTELALSGTSTRAEYTIAPDLWSADVDAGQIGQVVENLVINAAQAMAQGGVIRVAADNANVREGWDDPLAPGRYVRIEFSDSGAGIPAEHLGKIFDPYFTTKRDGTGLGLTTSYAIVSKHAGQLGVRSVAEHGSTFTVHLPAHDEKPAVVAEPDSAPCSDGKNRVLVMDDEGMVREVVREMLANAGYEVVLAANGEEAVTVYREACDTGARFDAVILDLTVRGGVGGKEAMRRLLDLDPDTVGIVCSGYSDDPVMAEFESHGFKGRIAKPFVTRALMTTLAQVLNA